jgi:Glycosyltransferase family 17
MAACVVGSSSLYLHVRSAGRTGQLGRLVRRALCLVLVALFLNTAHADEQTEPLCTLDSKALDALPLWDGITPRKVYDVFTYAYEKDILRIRVHELANVVDLHVVSVCNKSFSETPLRLDLNFTSFGPLAQKIQLVYCDDTWPNGTNPWLREYKLRDYGLAAVKRLIQPGDLALFTDVDEIPSAEMVRQLLRRTLNDSVVQLRMPLYKWSFGCVDAQRIGASEWCSATALGGARVLRESEGSHVRGMGYDCATPGPQVFCSGWHCSCCMKPHMVRHKFIHFSHAKDPFMKEYNERLRKNISILENQMRKCINADDSPFRRVSHVRGLPEALWMPYTRYLLPEQAQKLVPER